MIGHQNARVGRRTYLMDMADQGGRVICIAVARAVDGFVLLAGGLHGAVVAVFGCETTLALLALMAPGGARGANGLKELRET